MAAPLILLGCAILLLAAGRALPGWAVAAACGVGVLAAMPFAPVAPVSFGLSFAVDPLSRPLILAVLVAGASGLAAPGLAGAVLVALLAADGVGLVVGLALAVAMHAPARRSLPILAVAGVALVAALVLAGADPRFVAAQPGGIDGMRGAALAICTCVVAGLLPGLLPLGGLLAAGLVGRLLLDLAGPVAPVWWGVPVLAIGEGWALAGALRGVGRDTLDSAIEDAGAAAQALAIAGMGAALMARGADLLPLAGVGVAGALLTLLGWAVWGGVLALAGSVLRPAGTELVRWGGVLRRAPWTGMAMLAGFAGLAAAPLSAGFAGAWTVAQAIDAAGRLGGVSAAMVAGLALAAIGAAVALLALSALRLGGTLLLGTPRTARAGALVDPPRPLRFGLAALAIAGVALGLAPGLALLLIEPGARMLAGASPVPGPWGVIDVSAYPAGPLAVLVLVLAVIASWASHRRRPAVPAWQGGFAEQGIGRANLWTVDLPRPLAWPAPGRIALLLAAVLAAAALGWAAR